MNRYASFFKGYRFKSTIVDGYSVVAMKRSKKNYTKWLWNIYKIRLFYAYLLHRQIFSVNSGRFPVLQSNNHKSKPNNFFIHSTLNMCPYVSLLRFFLRNSNSRPKVHRGREDFRELKQTWRRPREERHKFAYLTMKTVVSHNLHVLFFILERFPVILTPLLFTSSNYLFCNCVDDVGIWRQIFQFFLTSTPHQFHSWIVSTHFARQIWTTEKWLQKHKVRFLGDVLAAILLSSCFCLQGS